MENQIKLNGSKEIIAWLAERFPNCFTIKSKVVRPLKIGIFQDIIERIRGEINLSKTQLRSALRLYTSSWRYLHGSKDGSMRIDLDGNACGRLEEQHVEYVRKQLEEVQYRIRHRQKKNREVIAKMPACRFRYNKINYPMKNKNQPDNNTSTNNIHSIQKFITDPHQDISNTQIIVNTTVLQVGQRIKVKISKNIVEAIVLEITKNNSIRVQLTSGLAMIVQAEHLLFLK